MKTNIPIELTDAQRDQLANLVDQKISKRLIRRVEIIEICRQHIGGLCESASESTAAEPLHHNQLSGDLYKVDPEDRALMAMPDDPSYVRGWNQVKRGK